VAILRSPLGVVEAGAAEAKSTSATHNLLPRWFWQAIASVTVLPILGFLGLGSTAWLVTRDSVDNDSAMKFTGRWNTC
jgi:hypothetical protein